MPTKNKNIHLCINDQGFSFNAEPSWQKSMMCLGIASSVSRKKLPNVYKSCPKMISLGKGMILTDLQKLPKNVGDSGKLIVAKGFE